MLKKKKEEKYEQSTEEKYEQTIEKKYQHSKTKKYLIVNKQNAPFDLQVRSQRFFQRLEPRGNQGDSCEIDSTLYEKYKEDFELQKDYILIKEL